MGTSNPDPLRVAEEYRAYFGKQALYDLIKATVNDRSFTPGELHEQVLKLPWSEVLTTNWDTLLERASLNINNPVYSVVSKQEDLSSARAPRLVKLHGTIDVTKDLVFTQEDYRKYPSNYAAFVNFSRQVFIENELCLLGFSGDDPNFLQWAGWVRDHLSHHSRRIYLVGALNLPPSRRKYLESINVAPIDLYDLVSEYDDPNAQHFEATRCFLKALYELKPMLAWEWSPTQLNQTHSLLTGLKENISDAQIKQSINEITKTLKKDRSSYPGWLVCPSIKRFELKSQISSLILSSRILQALGKDQRAKLLYEVAWRRMVTYDVVEPWLVSEFIKLCDPSEPCTLSKKQQLEIALLLLKSSRWIDYSEKEEIVELTSSILEKHGKYWTEASNELAYHQALLARDNLDYRNLELCVKNLKEANPIWKLRKASLLAELGRFEEGKVLISEAYRKLLSQYRNDQSSIHILSRLAWASWLMRSVYFLSKEEKTEELPVNYRELKCDPWDYLEQVRTKVVDDLERQESKKGVEPSFHPGRYKDKSNTVTFNNDSHSLLIYEGITNEVGIPLRWSNVNLLGNHAKRLCELDDLGNIHRLSLAIRTANSETSDSLNRVLSRVQVARLSESEVSSALRQCEGAIDYWLVLLSADNDKRAYAIEKLRVFIEALARLSTRANPEKAIKLYQMAISLGKNPHFRHWWLFKALGDLIDFSQKSIPEAQQHKILEGSLLFPLESEVNAEPHFRWPNPVVNHPGVRGSSSNLDRRIDEIIEKISPLSEQSVVALERLIPLGESDFLTDNEKDKLAVQLWPEHSCYEELPTTGLLNYVLLKLPARDKAAVTKLVKNYLFENRSIADPSDSLLNDLISASLNSTVKLFPSESQAKRYFKELVAWRPSYSDDDVTGQKNQYKKELAKLVSETLSRSIVPALSDIELTKKNFKKLKDFYNDVKSPEILIAFSYFAAADINEANSVKEIIRRGFQLGESETLAFSTFALLRWRELEKCQATDELILRLVHLINYNLPTRIGAPLWTILQLLKQGYLSKDNIRSVTDSVPIIFDSCGYQNILPSSRDSISNSLVRATCVNLAQEIIDKGFEADDLYRVLEEAKEDPLPEVRFANHKC